MTAYCLFDNVEVTDPAAMAEYASKVGEMVRRHGGRYLALGGRWRPSRAGRRSTSPS